MPRDFDFPPTFEQERLPEQPENTLKDYTERTRIHRGRMDIPFLALVLAIVIIGVIMVFSASFARSYYDPKIQNATYYFRKQTFLAIFSIVALYVASRVRIRTIRRYSKLLMFGAVGTLVLVLVIGFLGGGSRRWIDLWIFNFQPSEMAKMSIVLFFSAMACRYGKKMHTLRYGVVPFLIWIIIIAVLLYLEPHYSGMIIIAALGMVIMFAGGGNLLHLGILVALAVAGGFAMLMLRGYTSQRIAAWLNPEAFMQGDGWQIMQSLYAVGSGGLLGMGLGQGIQKYLYLPEEHNDYIFAVICEELGFIGAALILALFILLVARGYWLALHARDRYSSLITIGFTTHIALQTFLNVAVVLNVIPSTGISLPFISTGGSALLFQLIEMGIILSVSRDIEEK